MHDDSDWLLLSDNNDYIHELDSTPPASPMLSGRYRNLGPELAACIPKRQLKFTTNWLRDGPNSLGYQWRYSNNFRITIIAIIMQFSMVGPALPAIKDTYKH